MAFVKLDTGILDSSLWSDPVARMVFLTALLMATPVELVAPTPTLQVDSPEPGGFTIPPGWYGIVPAAGIGIIRRSLIDAEPGWDALRTLARPEAESRTPDHGGRRLVRIAGGFIVLNFQAYRDRDHTAAERSWRWRQRQKGRAGTGNATPLRNVTEP